MPDASSAMLDLVAAPADARDFGAIEGAPLSPGVALPKPTGIFPRYQGPEAAA